MDTAISAIPVDLTPQTDTPPTSPQPPTPTLAPESAPSVGPSPIDESRIVSYVVDWKNKLRRNRTDKVNVWNECWQLYRGVEDFSNKEDWQSQIVLPKSWASVKQATSTIKRLLRSAKDVWTVESINPDDYVLVTRSNQVGQLTKVFLENARYMDAFAEGLECGFIIGLGVWKLWWALEPRQRTRVIAGVQDPQGQFQQVDELQAMQAGLPVQRQLVREEVMEGKLQIKAVDPYNFWWLPGSKLNRWTGTIEEIEIPKWELNALAEQGVFDAKKLSGIQPRRIPEDQKQSFVRFGERASSPSPASATDNVVLTEFFGPLIIDDQLLERHAHLIIANDQTLLLNDIIRTWEKKPPYIGFSPLLLPFRTDGVGLIENVRQIDKALSKLANMSVDTLLFKLSPIFEINLDAYENPEDFETGLTPGKVLRRNNTYVGQAGLQPIGFEDISQGSVQVQASLDRYHQEGALVSEIQQALPRYRGVQTATEIETKSANQDSFFGAMAADIEAQALEPIVAMAVDLILQYIDTANDPRVASILGLEARTLQALSKEELLELVQGDYQIKVSGISEQLNKAEMLQNLVQLMNLLGQNAQAWMPYIKQDEFLRRILEAFRPTIREIENVVAEPALVQAKQLAATEQAITPDVVGMIPQLVQMGLQAQQQRQQAEMQAQQQQAQQQAEQSRSEHELALEATRADQEMEIARMQAAQPSSETSTQ